MHRVKADIAILGSGFGGTLTALILNRIGLKVVLIDKATHPRFAIGESSTPIANMVLRDLADTYDLPRLRPLSKYGLWQKTYPHLVCGPKRGFSYFYHQPNRAYQPDDKHTNELLVAASRDDYHCDTHWLRADVDAFFAEEVRRSNIPFFENTDTTSLNCDAGWQLFGNQEKHGIQIDAEFLIDATGTVGVVRRTLDIPNQSRHLQTVSRAIFSHFSGVKKWHEMMCALGGRVSDHPYCCDHAALHHILDGGWMWVLRFDNGLTSAGLMLDAGRYPLDSSISPQTEWEMWLQRYPSLQEQFTEAQIAHPPGQLIRTRRLQRKVTQVVGENWALLPHTAGFIDPLHSTGIAHTLCGVERLTSLIAKYWNSDCLADRLTDYERAVLREIKFIDYLVSGCYAAFGNFRLMTAFTMLYFAAAITYEQQRTQHREHATLKSFNRFFLCADDEELYHIAADTYLRLKELLKYNRVKDTQISDFEHSIEAAIKPYNTAGLFCPPVHNMYHHTVTPN